MWRWLWAAVLVLVLLLAVPPAIQLATRPANPGGAGLLQLSPSVRPEEVVLKAAIVPADRTVCVKTIKWGLVVELDRRTAAPLFNGDDPNRYLSEVNTFDGRQLMSTSDAGPGCVFGQTVPVEGLAFGNDGPLWALTLRTAKANGAMPPDWPVNTMGPGNGFSYSGNVFPLRVRYYLPGDQPPDHPFTVVYTHYQERWGQDLSWTKVVKVQPPAPQ